MNDIKHAYNRWASTYDSDRNLTRDLDAAVTRDALAVMRATTVLELGCGTGKNTATLAGLAQTVVALDFSTEMLAQARLKVTAPNVCFVHADLTRPWPLAPAAVDLIVSNLVLEHVPDLDAVFAEAARVLAARGRWFLSELHPFKQYEGKKATFARGGETLHIAATVHHVSAYLDAASRHGFALLELREWWHDEDAGKPPRLLTLLLAKLASAR